MGKKASSLLGCFGKSIASRPKEVTIPVCKTLVSLHLEHCVPDWALQYETHAGVSPGKRHGGEGIEAFYTQGDAGRAGTIQPAKKEAWKVLIHVHNECLMVGEVKMVFSEAINNETRSSKHKLKYRKLNIRFFFCESNRTLEVVTQRSCGVTVLGAIQNSPEQNHDPSTLSDTALCRGSRGASAILWFCPDKATWINPPVKGSNWVGALTAWVILCYCE